MSRLPFWMLVLLAVPAIAQVGELDTIGGTTYDLSTPCSGVQPLVQFDLRYGVHAAWTYSAETATTFPDRNTGYNFRDVATGTWNWLDDDFMLSGVRVFDRRACYGSVDFDPATGVPVICTHTGDPLYPILARGLAPGSPTFEVQSGSTAVPEYLWPLGAVSGSGAIHLAMTDAGLQTTLRHTRCTDWRDWSPPFDIPAGQHEPSWPDYYIAASKQSGKVAILWEYSEGAPDPGFCRRTTDDGVTWQPPVDIGWPPAFGGDTVPSYHISSFGAMYDRDDTLRVVASVQPFVDEMYFPAPTEIWHYCPGSDPAWSRVHRAEADTLEHGLGYNTILATRPTIGQDPVSGKLYAAWSQHDPDNVDPVTEVVRADIWVCASDDNGATWTEPVRLTGPDQASRMYFDLARCVNDTLHFVYQEDQVAGQGVLSVGPLTDNPMIYHKVPADIVGVAEPGGVPVPVRAEPFLGPNPSRGRVRLQLAGTAQRARAVVYDASGRLVESAALAPGAALDMKLQPGVYLVRVEDGRRTWQEKVTVVD